MNQRGKRLIGIFKAGERRCEARGHSNKYGGELSGYLLCNRCMKWWPKGDPMALGVSSIPFGAYANTPMKPISNPLGSNFNELIQMPHPFEYLRDNPEVLENTDHMTLRRLIIDRLADYEAGVDDEGHDIL